MLEALYEKYRLSASRSLAEEGAKFFPPLLLDVPQDWTLANHRVLYIGQETLGWSWSRKDVADYGYKWDRPDIYTLSDFFNIESACSDLMDGYRQFDFSAKQPLNYRGPFWRYFRRIKERLSNTGETVSALSSNVIRCAADAEKGFTLWDLSKVQRDEYLNWQSGLLSEEIEELRPTFVLFVTGPNYDDYLNREFGGLRFESMDGFNQRQLSRLSASRLSAPTYRTYHPGYLNRSLGFKPIEAALRDAGIFVTPTSEGEAPVAWSSELQSRTQQALKLEGDVTFSHEWKMALKHIEGRFGFVLLDDVLKGRMIVIDRISGKSHRFASVNELTGAGWAID